MSGWHERAGVERRIGQVTVVATRPDAEPQLGV